MQVPSIIIPSLRRKPGSDNVFRYLIASSMVHFRSSLLFLPDVSFNTFSSSVQYHLITPVAPRGGLQAMPAHRL